VATNYYLIYNSTRGLREELFANLLLIFLYFSVITGENNENYLKASFFATLLFLTRYEGFLSILAVVFWLTWRARSQDRKIPRKKIGVILFFILLSFLFVVVYGTIVLGDPFATSTTQGSWFYWYEFTPHDPLYLEWREQGFSISMLEYIFVYHTPRELFQGVILGLFRLAEIGNLFGISYFWAVLLMLGILSTLVEDKGSYLAILLVLIVPFLAFFYYISWDNRLFFSYYPIFSVLMSNVAFRLFQSAMLYINNINTFNRLFATAIFWFVLLQYARLNLKPHAPTIYYPVLAGLMLFVLLFVFYL